MKTNRPSRIIRITGGVIAAVFAFGVSASKAHAQSELELISGSTTEIVPGSSGEGIYNAAIGGWNVDVTVGLAPPTAASDTIELNTSLFSESGTSTPLEIIWSSDGFTPGTYTVADGGTVNDNVNVTLGSYYGSLMDTSTPLATSTTFTTSPFSATLQGSANSPSFAITEVAVVNGASSPGSQTSFSESISLVPEPSTTALSVIGGLATVCGFSSIRKRHET